MTVSTSRRIAFHILCQVQQDGFADDLLREQSTALDSRDAGLARELVMGCLRYQRQLDWVIEMLAKRAAESLDAPLLIALRMGIYQLRYLDRVPRYAAVSESVELARLAGKAKASGLVNAVLRRVTRTKIKWPRPAIEHSLPDWLWNKWESQMGAARAGRVAASALQTPQTYIRVPPGREPEAEALGAEHTEVAGCYRLAGTDRGPFRVQDIGAQTIVPLLNLHPGHRFLDVAAAPGNKTLQALEVAVHAVAGDRSLSRLQMLRGVGAGRVVFDAQRGFPFLARFDRILVDAPCSGTGTLARNPEIRWRVRPEDLARHQRRQRLMLGHALNCLVPGGSLVYATCSLEPEENEEVVDFVLAQPESGSRTERFRLAHTMRRVPGEHPGDGFFAAVITSN